MSDEVQPAYEPTRLFTSQSTLYGNHFRFVLDALPDLTFFVQNVVLPDVIATPIKRPNPFTTIVEVNDHLTYGNLAVSFLIDKEFKTYNSLYWWMKGYGFPHTYEEVAEFRRVRVARLAQPRPQTRELEKTNAVLYILAPDLDNTVAEVRFTDVIPTQIGQLEFSTTPTDVSEMKTTAVFNFTDFDIVVI